MNYHTTSIIWLALEDYYNKGMSPEQARQTIESLTDPCSGIGLKLRCEEQGINHNWNVRTSATHPQAIERVVLMIQDALDVNLSNDGTQRRRDTDAPIATETRTRRSLE